MIIKEAEYTSVWDSGITITSKCEVDMESREVFNIEPVDVEGLLC